MPAVSKSQQELMGIALCVKRGGCKDASQEAKDLANLMSLSDLEDFAKTKHAGLPDKVAKKESIEFLTFDEFIKEKNKTTFE